MRAEPTGTSPRYTGRPEDNVGAGRRIQTRRLCLTRPSSRSMNWHRGERSLLASSALEVRHAPGVVQVIRGPRAQSLGSTLTGPRRRLGRLYSGGGAQSDRPVLVQSHWRLATTRRGWPPPRCERGRIPRSTLVRRAGDTGRISGDTGRISRWTRLAPATNPVERDSAAMAYDPTSGTLILFGGDDGTNFAGLPRSTIAAEPVLRGRRSARGILHA